MSTLLGNHYVLPEVTQTDMNIASIAFGFTLGFGLLTAWTAVKQTKGIWMRHKTGVFKSPYVWMIWLEIIDCLVFSIICWLHLKGAISPRQAGLLEPSWPSVLTLSCSFAFFFVICTYHMASRKSKYSQLSSNVVGPASPDSVADHHQQSLHPPHFPAKVILAQDQCRRCYHGHQHLSVQHLDSGTTSSLPQL